MPRDPGTGIYNYPDGTRGISGQTIYSGRYNTFIDDLSTTMNAPLPVNMGGTGANNDTTARTNLKAERAMATVTNYDTQVWESGSFWSAGGATAAPTANMCSGICYVTNNDQNYVTLEARDSSTGIRYVRRKVGGTWVNSGAWASEDDRFVNITGDTMTGALTVNASIWSANSSTSGTYQFGTGGGKYLLFDGTSFALSGGALNVNNGGITCNGQLTANQNIMSANTATTGTYYFGASGTKSLSYDGTNFTLAGGALYSGSIVASGDIVGRDFQAQRTSNAAQGLVFFGNTGTKYLIFDGTQFIFNGGSLTVNGNINTSFPISGSGIVCRPGAAGASRGNVFNIDYPGPQLWIDNTNFGTFAFTSDYRIKKDVAGLPGTWDMVKALRPIKYTQAEYAPKGSEAPLFVADDIERWGFIAHELQDTLIESAATGYKDAPDVVQSPNPWTVIAALTKALQEAMTRIEALEAA